MSNNEWLQAIGLTIIVAALIGMFMRLDRVLYKKHDGNQQ
ncbi:Uncharacterised protein [Shimwellia blattae]|nr:Uncharacterised protein [Shimwellia blattae]VEC22705.1 Uncharacterised protein [Shimwellia blattae]